MKRLSIVIALLVVALGFNGCASNSSGDDSNISSQNNEEKSISTGSNKLSGTCVTNSTSIPQITQDMLMDKVVYSGEGGEYNPINVSYVKNEFISDSKILRTQINSTIANGTVESSDIITKEDSYELISGGILLHRTDGKTWLLALDTINDNGDWTMLIQEITNNVCPGTSNVTTWSFVLPPYYPEELA